MPALCLVAEVCSPASNTTTTHSTSMTLPVARRDFKTTQRIDMPTSALCGSCPADAFRVLKRPRALSGCGGTPSRVQHNLDSPPRPTSKGPEHVRRRDFRNTQRTDMPTSASSRSRPEDAFKVLIHACSLSAWGGTPSRVQHNHLPLYFQSSTCRKT